MPFPALPALLTWTLGTLGAVVLARFVAKEHRRVNGELDEMRGTPVMEKADRREYRTLRRDPRTGIYRPQ